MNVSPESTVFIYSVKRWELRGARISDTLLAGCGWCAECSHCVCSPNPLTEPFPPWAGPGLQSLLESFFFFLLLQIYRNFKNEIFEEFLFYMFIFWSSAKVLQLENLSYFLENLDIWHWSQQTCLPIKIAEENNWSACLVWVLRWCCVGTGTVSSWSAATCRPSYLAFLFFFYFILLFLIVHQYFSLF